MDLNTVWGIIEEGLKMPFTYFTNPNKRINWIYLSSSLFLAYYVYTKTKHKVSFLQYVFSKEVWCSSSSYVDYAFIFFNSFVKILLIGPYLYIGLTIAFYTNEYLMSSIGILKWSLSENQTLILYTIFITLINDFFSFLIHYTMHKIPSLWEFHKIHHSATVLNPLTQYRIHPVELIINNLKVFIVFGIVTGIFDYLSVHTISKVLFMGANIFSFAFLFFGSNLRHSQVPLKYFDKLERIFISPYQHQIHHSDNPIHYDTNMGSKLALWDWMFGTLVRSKSVTKLRFGLGEENLQYRTFWQNLYMPFKNLYQFNFKKYFRK